MGKLILTSQMGNCYLVFICLPDRYLPRKVMQDRRLRKQL